MRKKISKKIDRAWAADKIIFQEISRIFFSATNRTELNKFTAVFLELYKLRPSRKNKRELHTAILIHVAQQK